MAEVRAAPYPEIRFLWHPGTRDVFSGYGLVIGPAHVVGLIMVDRPAPADPAWFAWIAHVCGAYQLTAMTTSGERGLVCQMLIAEQSTQYLRVLPHPRLGALREALLPLDLPAVTLRLAWAPDNRCWVSQLVVPPGVPLFPLGHVVATPEAFYALERAEQTPEEFLNRHDRGDWGDVSDADKHENTYAVQYGFRILSAYTTSTGDRLWILTKADRSATTILLPHEY